MQTLIWATGFIGVKWVDGVKCVFDDDCVYKVNMQGYRYYYAYESTPHLYCCMENPHWSRKKEGMCFSMKNSVE